MKQAPAIASIFAAMALAGCLPDTSYSAPARSEGPALRAQFSATALQQFAFSDAATQAHAFQVVRSDDGRMASIRCPAQGQAGAVVAWFDNLGVGVQAAEVARHIAPEYRATVRGGVLAHKGLTLAKGCTVPRQSDGAPVVIVPIGTGPTDAGASYRDEYAAESCGPGYAGAEVRKRVVTLDAQGKAAAGEWEEVTGRNCLPTMTATASADVQPVPGWGHGRPDPVSVLLDDNSPENCKTVTVTAAKGDGRPVSYTVNTCAKAPAAYDPPEYEPAPPPPFDPPEPPPPPKPVCPGSVDLPTASSKAAYAAAIAPYEAMLPTLPRSCSVIITSTAMWPHWVTFNIEETNGRLVRMYHSRLVMLWTAQGGDSGFMFAANSWRSLYAVPDWLSTRSENWLRLKWTGTGRGEVYTMQQRTYWEFFGPNTAPSVGLLGTYVTKNFPVPYANPGADPWGNTPDQLAHQHGISYNAFKNRRYRFEGSF